MYDQDLDMLSMYGQGGLLQSVFVAGETLVELEPDSCTCTTGESFSPLSIRIPVDLETLPMMLRFGVKLNNDLHNIGQTAILLHLDGLKAVMFSYVFINKGLSCLSILM